MSKAALNSVFRRLTTAQLGDGPPDQHLLERFVSQQDEAAFAALVERHGSMVVSVARNVLNHPQDAEDVFQATFLVLARRAGSIRKLSSVGSWLHGVAYRLAHNAKRAALARNRVESHAPARVSAESPDDLTWRELRAILHEEMERLSDKYRAPLVLCYLEGMTQDKAAEHLRLPEGTLRGRLERARLLLRGRLSRRGLAPAVLLLADASPQVSAAIPEILVLTAIRSAGAVALGRSAVVSVQVAGMTEGALRAMFMTKLRFSAILALLAFGLAAATGVLVARSATDGPPAKSTPLASGQETPEKTRTAERPESPWSEAVGGWRIRMTTPSGAEYRENARLPLSLELQNVSGGPLSCDLLASYADLEATQNGTRLIVRTPIDISPWEGRRDPVPAGGSLTWTVDFNRLRFSTQPLQAGTTLQVKFRLSMRGATPAERDAGKPRNLFSNEVTLKLRDNHPPVMTGESDLPRGWADSMLLIYRDHQGLQGFDALRIDEKGHAVVVTVGYGKGKPITNGLIRTEAVLDREHLDRLAKFIRDQKLWEVPDLTQEKIPLPDEGEIQISVGAGHGSLVGRCPDRSVRDQPKLLALKAEMAKLMEVVRKEAAAKDKNDDPMEGKPPKIGFDDLMKAMELFRKELPPPQGLNEQIGRGVTDLDGKVHPNSHLAGIAKRLGAKSRADCMGLLTYVTDRDPKIRRIAVYAIESVVNAYPNGLSAADIEKLDSEGHREVVKAFLAGIEKLPK